MFYICLCHGFFQSLSFRGQICIEHIDDNEEADFSEYSSFGLGTKVIQIDDGTIELKKNINSVCSKNTEDF